MRLLYQDLARQYALEGRPQVKPNLFRFLCALLHPRYLPIVLYRGSRWAMLHRLPVAPRLLTYLNIVLFGLEISPRCAIGPGVFFPHTSGTVVGASRIGRNATIYQGVTLGAKELNMVFDPALRPQVGDNVILGSGCKVLGGISIGDNVTVGANSVLLESVEPGVIVVGIPARKVGFSARGQQ